MPLHYDIFCSRHERERGSCNPRSGIGEGSGGSHVGGGVRPAAAERADGAADVGGGPDGAGVHLHAQDAQGERRGNQEGIEDEERISFVAFSQQ